MGSLTPRYGVSSLPPLWKSTPDENMDADRLCDDTKPALDTELITTRTVIPALYFHITSPAPSLIYPRC